MKTKILAVLLTLVTFSGGLAMAAPTGSEKSTTTPARGLTQAAAKSDQIDNLKKRATNEIDRRLAALNLVMGKVNSLKRLSSSQKLDLINGIQTQITSLTSLESKIQADTDLTVLKTDVKSIVDSYRIFLLYIPKVHIIATAETLETYVDQANNQVSKLQTILQKLQSQGKDVSALQTKLTDMMQKLQDAKTQAQNAVNLVLPLTPDGYPANKSVLQNARTLLQTSRHDIDQARNDAKDIISGIKELRKTLTPTPTITSSH